MIQLAENHKFKHLKGHKGDDQTFVLHSSSLLEGIEVHQLLHCGRCQILTKKKKKACKGRDNTAGCATRWKSEGNAMLVEDLVS